MFAFTSLTYGMSESTSVEGERDRAAVGCARNPSAMSVEGLLVPAIGFLEPDIESGPRLVGFYLASVS